mmetsp:Transcript_9157/g.20273  ORF Transcript_9157/g.20273 Transcript_9157/m.20273 type:complete len:264 (+) Transcript_9157:723-1514(+)
MTLRLHELRGEVVRGAASGEGLTGADLRQSHIGDLDVSLLVQQQVLGFEVSEDDFALVHVVKGEDDARDVELRVAFLAVKVLLVVGGVQLSAQSKLEEEVEALVTVESFEELDDEGRVAEHLHLLLADDTLLHSGLHDVAFAECLQGVSVPGLHVLDELHGTEATTAEQAEPLQVALLNKAVALSVDGLVFCLGARGPARLLDVGQRSEQHLEGLPVQSQSSCDVRDDFDSRRSGLGPEKSLLAEDAGAGGGRFDILLAASTA